MGIQERKEKFEQQCREQVAESTLLTFQGVEGFDVYNCSIPFCWEGKEYLFGRVERRTEWARSWVRLFEKTGQDTYTLVEGYTPLQLEDPFVSFIGGEIVLGGTHVRIKQGKIDTYYGYFYRGKRLDDLRYFTTGPDRMKDIRLVELADGRIGVFSRPNHPGIREQYGCSSMIGYTTISSLDELNDEVVTNATPIEGIFDRDEWGGCNQAYLLADGKIGVIGHQSYSLPKPAGSDMDRNPVVYVNIAFEFDPETFAVSNRKVIGTRCCYPDYPCKKPFLADCTFTSGIVMREDGKADLYGGIGDTAEGRIVIDYPFSQPLMQK